MDKRNKNMALTAAAGALAVLALWGAVALLRPAGKPPPPQAFSSSKHPYVSNLYRAAIKIPRGLHLAELPWPSGGQLPPGFHFAHLAWLRSRGPADISRLRLSAAALGGATGALANPLHLVHKAYVPWPRFPGFTLPVPARFITALCRDKTGNVWIATEDHGVYRYDPAAPTGRQVEQFTKQNTTGKLGNNNIYALACDNHGRVWAGTLNRGVAVWNGWRWQDYDIVQNPEKHVLAGPLGDHIFALKFDKYTDQMWICTDAGISVYQCAQEDSPNTRLHHARNLNLSSVTFAPGTWHYVTQADGLPQNPDCIAFGKNGTVYIGTQCAGIAIGTPLVPAPSTHYSLDSPTYRWRIVPRPWKMPLTVFGKGLPSDLINAIAITPNGTVVAGTDGGIAFGKPAGRAGRSEADWTFEHGQDFPAKVLGLWRPPQHWPAPSAAVLNALPMEDYTTAVAFTEQRSMTNDQEIGRTHSSSQLLTSNSSSVAAGYRLQGTGYTYLWLGHRRRGIDVWQYNTAGTIIKRWQIHEPQIGNYVTSLLPLPGGAMVVGTYGKGVSIIMLPGASVAWKKTDHAAAQPYVAPGFAGGAASTTGGQAAPDTGPAIHEPKPAAAPGVRQLAALYQSLVKEPVSQEPTGLRVVPITDDWRTEGSWLGRYGRYWACLYACSPPPDVGDYVWGPGPLALYHEEGIGPHHRLHDYGRYHLSCGDAIRYYVTWLSTAKKRVLELPEVYLDQCIAEHTATWKADRREAEIDDHGEVYPMSWQGPGLYIYLHIPPGAYTLSLYFFNKDGHSGNNRDRDYVVSIIPVPAGYHFGTASRPNTAPLAAMRGAVQSRVVNFWGGVWKRFLVRGPMKLAIRVAKNYSFNTILQAAMLGPLSEHPAPYYYGYKAWQIHEKQRSGTRTQLAAAWRTGQIPWHRSQQFIRRVEVAAARLLLRPPSSNRTGGITASGSPKDFFLRHSRATTGQGHTQRLPAQQQQVVPPSAFRRLGMATLASA